MTKTSKPSRRQRDSKRSKGASKRAPGRGARASGVTSNPPAKKDQGSEFQPTEKQRAYLVHLLQGYANGGDVTDRSLAEVVEVHATTISHWRDDARFETWVASAFDRFLSGGLRRVLVRAMTLAARGSVKHMEFFAKYSGQAAEAAPAGPADVGAYSVVLLSPRPPALSGSGDRA